MHVRAVATLALLALAAPGAALAEQNPAPMEGGCGDGPGTPAENMVAPASLRPALRAVFLKAHPQLRPAEVVGPLPGRTFYGMKSAWYAVAEFSVDGHRATPTVFWRSKDHPWRFSNDTHGGVAAWITVPGDLLGEWGFTQWRHSNYYIPPR